MDAVLRLSISALLLFHGVVALAQGAANSTYKFTTRKYSIEMQISSPAPYEGRRLTVYRNGDPGKEMCLPLDTASSPCVENFVGAVALVTFLAKRSADGKAATASIRERATLMEQSPELPERLPFAMSIRLVNGVGSDVQVFGYDESPLPQHMRASQRKGAQSAYRRFRQEIYMDKDRDPFAVIEWLHTIRGIRTLQVDAPSSQARTNR